MKVGDVVRLKSGGPDMTVAKQTSSPAYWFCQWFTGDDLKSGTFEAETLETVEPDEGDGPTI